MTMKGYHTMKTVRNTEREIEKKLSEIDDLIFDWMTEMDMPEGTTISGDVHFARGQYLDAIKKNMTDLLKAVDDGMYCMDCGALITEYNTIWNHDHECYCKTCAIKHMIPF